MVKNLPQAVEQYYVLTQYFWNSVQKFQFSVS